jgi:purine-nucleoside phosphorylase
MSEPYSKRLAYICESAALELGIKIHRGVYAAMTGPSLETRAEYRFLRTIGADVVGMSTVPETIVARQLGVDVLGLSIITDECYPDALKPVNINEILANAAAAEPSLTQLVKFIIEKTG